MAISTTMLDNDMDTMIADLNSTLVWTPSGGSQQTVTGTKGEVTQTKDSQLPGYYADLDLEWVGLVADFTSSVTPSVGNKVTVDSASYRVESRLLGQGGIAVRLLLKRQ